MNDQLQVLAVVVREVIVVMLPKLAHQLPGVDHQEKLLVARLRESLRGLRNVVVDLSRKRESSREEEGIMEGEEGIMIMMRRETMRSAILEIIGPEAVEEEEAVGIIIVIGEVLTIGEVVVVGTMIVVGVTTIVVGVTTIAGVETVDTTTSTLEIVTTTKTEALRERKENDRIRWEDGDRLKHVVK